MNAQCLQTELDELNAYEWNLPFQNTAACFQTASQSTLSKNTGLNLVASSWFMQFNIPELCHRQVTPANGYFVINKFTSNHYLMVSHQQTEDNDSCYARTALENTHVK